MPWGAAGNEMGTDRVTRSATADCISHSGGQCEKRPVRVGGIAREPTGGPVHADDGRIVCEIGRSPMEYSMKHSVGSAAVASECAVHH